MDGIVNTPHRIVTAPGLAEPSGYAHAVVPAAGTTVYLGGQTALGPDGGIVGDGLVEQFDVAAGNVVAALEAAGGRPEHLVSLLIYVTDMARYRLSLRELAPLYRNHFGRHYPAIALIGVAELFDAEAQVELVATVVVP